MSEPSDPRIDEAQRLDREVAALRNAMALLGLKQCSWCRKYVRFAEPGALFDGGELVCYSCSLDWWQAKCQQMQGDGRSAVEKKLVHWLIYTHHAKVIRPAGKGVGSWPEGPHLSASCIECNAKGKDSAGGHCSFCNGLGIISVFLTEKQ